MNSYNKTIKLPTTPQEFHEQYPRQFSPSGSSRWMTCTGSVAANIIYKRKYPDKESLSSTYASEGTIAHAIAARCVKDDLSPFVFIGEDHTADDGTSYTTKVDQEMATAVQQYVDYVLVLAHPVYEPIMEVEKTLDLDQVSPYIRSGTADCWIYQSTVNTLHVIDYKHGSGIYVETNNNTQLMIYALGALFHLTRNFGVQLQDVQKVVIHIVQPRALNGTNQPHSFELTVPALQWFHETIKWSIASAFSESPVFSPSEHNCRWCAVKGECTARAEQNMKQAQLDFNHLVLYEDGQTAMQESNKSPVTGIYDEIPTPSFPEIALLSRNELSAILKWEAPIKRFLADVYEHAFKLHKSGQRIPLQKLVRGRSQRTWKSEKEAKILCQQNTLTDEELYTKPKFKSPAQIEATFKAKKLDKTVLETVIIKPEGELKLASVYDKRPEVNPETLAHHDFAEFK